MLHADLDRLIAEARAQYRAGVLFMNANGPEARIYYRLLVSLKMACAAGVLDMSLCLTGTDFDALCSNRGLDPDATRKAEACLVDGVVVLADAPESAFLGFDADGRNSEFQLVPDEELIAFL